MLFHAIIFAGGKQNYLDCPFQQHRPRFDHIFQMVYACLTIVFAIFVGLISNVMKEKWAYTLPECTVVTVAQGNVICASGDPQQTGNRSDYSYDGNWGMIGSDD